MRFLLYSHDGLGLGHTRRNLAIANAVAEMAPDASILLSTGIQEVTQFKMADGIDTLKLPSLRKTGNGHYAARHLHLQASEIRAIRSTLLLTAVKSFRPALVLVDKHPFGASGELRRALEFVRGYGGRMVLGLRDILDERATVLKEWGTQGLLKRIADFYDQVLVYGHPSIYDPTQEYDFPPPVAERTRFCGYVVNQEPRDPRGLPPLADSLKKRRRATVLATAGGGEDGSFLLENFIRAAAGASWHGIVVAGPMTPAHELKSLQRLAADAKVSFYGFMPNLSSLFWSVDALVTMGGYNTIAEALSKGLPLVCVPRVTPRTEQWLRATAFEKLGLLRTVLPDQLNVETLRIEIEEALTVPRQELLDRMNSLVHFDGARQAATHLLTLAASTTTPAILTQDLRASA